MASNLSLSLDFLWKYCERMVTIHPEQDPEYVQVKIRFMLPRNLVEPDGITKFGFAVRMKLSDMKGLKECELMPVYELKDKS